MTYLPKSPFVDRFTQAAGYALSLPANLMSGLTHLFSDAKPQSASEVLRNAKEHGSALLGSDVGPGQLLIEVYRGENGRWIFTATDWEFENLKTIVESDGYTDWEEEVERYLSAYMRKKRPTSADYGVTQRRWRNDEFSDLLTYFVTKNYLVEDGENLQLKFPGENGKYLIPGPYAKEKAKIILKRYYHKMDTPKEEAASEAWKTPKKVFFDYLMHSGYLLTPRHDRTVSLEERRPTVIIIPEGSAEGIPNPTPYRSGTVEPSLYDLSSTLPSFRQTAISAATVGLTTGLMTGKPEAGFLAGLTSLLPQAEAFSIPTERTSLTRTTDPISAIIPLPDLSVVPGQQLSQLVDLRDYFQTANQNSNLELSMKQANGTAAPNWLTLSMGPISQIRSYDLGYSVVDIRVSGRYAYAILKSLTDCSTNYCQEYIYVFDVGNPAQVNFVGSLAWPDQCVKYPPSSLLLKDNYALYSCMALYSGAPHVVDITDPSKIKAVNSLSGIYGACGMESSGNYLYVYCPTLLRVYDITNPASLPYGYECPLSGTLYKPNPVSVHGNYAYVAAGNAYNVLSIVDIADPRNPTFVKQLTLTGNSVIAAPLARNNKLYLAADTNVKIYTSLRGLPLS